MNHHHHRANYINWNFSIYKAEHKSQETFKKFKEDIIGNKETLEINEKGSKGYAYTYEMLYARNNFGTKPKTFNKSLKVSEQ